MYVFRTLQFFNIAQTNSKIGVLTAKVVEKN